MQFQSHRLVKLQTFMYFIMAQWPGKPRIVCLHLEEALETVFEDMKLDTYKKRNLLYYGLVSILVAHTNKPCGVVLCLFEIIKKSWSHGSNFCFLSHETWSSTRFSICTEIKNRESSKNWDSQQTVNLLLSGTVKCWQAKRNSYEARDSVKCDLSLALNNRGFPLFFLVHILCSAWSIINVDWTNLILPFRGHKADLFHAHSRVITP